MKKLFLIVIFLIGLVLVFPVALHKYDRHERCQKVLAMAVDAKKVAYMEQWVEHNLDDKELLGTIGYSGRVEYSVVEKKRFDSLNVNWDFLGINVEYASLSLIRSDEAWDDFTNPDNIKAVSFNEGRYSVILKIDPKFEVKNLGRSPNLREVQIVNDRVSVYCD